MHPRRAAPVDRGRYPETQLEVVDGLALAEALWARMCAGTREDGSQIEPNDPIWNDLQAAALASKTSPMAWLDQKHLYGDLNQDDVFSERFEFWLSKVWSDGTESALSAYLSS